MGVLYRVYDDQGRCRGEGEGLGGVKAYGKALVRGGHSETLTWTVVENEVERPLEVAGYLVLPDPDEHERRADCDRVCPDLVSARSYAQWLLSLARVVEIWEHNGEHATYVWETLTQADRGWDPLTANARGRLSSLAV